MTSDVQNQTTGADNEITKSDLTRMALNEGSLGMEYSWTYYKQMNLAFAVMMGKMLKKIYPDDEQAYADALGRHSAFFNITVQFAPFVGGIALSMEERIKRGEIAPESVNDVKAALMGPLSGLGDSIFLATIRVIAAAVGISLCQAGNVLGPLVFLLIYNVPGFLTRVWGAHKGYELGVSFLERAQATGIMSKIMTSAAIIGAMVIGAMTMDMFAATIPLEIGGDATVQSILDDIMPGLLGLGAFWIYYALLAKKVNPSLLIIGTMVLGIAGAYFGFLA